MAGKAGWSQASEDFKCQGYLQNMGVPPGVLLDTCEGFSFMTVLKLGICIPILEMKKLSQTKWSAQGHSVSKWLSWNLNQSVFHLLY